MNAEHQANAWAAVIRRTYRPQHPRAGIGADLTPPSSSPTAVLIVGVGLLAVAVVAYAKKRGSGR